MKFITIHNVPTVSFPMEQRSVGCYSSVIKRAENIIGYPTSFLNLRWLVNDELANISIHIKKLLATKHPILKTARQLLLSSNVPSWGLIVLLVSKMIDSKQRLNKDLQDSKSGILYSQRTIAECVEMLRTSNILHKAIIGSHVKRNEEIVFGNKMSLLGGDYLLAKSFKEIALLRNTYIQELMSSGVRDMSESQFLGTRDNDNNPLPNKPNIKQKDIDVPECFTPTSIDSTNIMGHMKSEWILRNLLDCSHLLARACQSTLHLNVKDDSILNLGYQIGRNYALFEQAHQDIILLNNDKFALTAAPVMLHLEADPNLYADIEKGVKNVNDVNYDLIRKKILLKGDGIRKTQRLKTEFLQNAIMFINEFPKSDARHTLIDIMYTVNKLSI